MEVVPRDTPAWNAGVNVDDEIVAIDDFRVRADQLEARLEAYKPGQRVTLLVARRDELKRLDVVLGAPPPNAWRLEPLPGVTADQGAHLEAWAGRRK